MPWNFVQRDWCLSCHSSPTFLLALLILAKTMGAEFDNFLVVLVAWLSAILVAMTEAI